MSKLGYLGFAAVGLLTACGGMQPEVDEGLTTDALASSRSTVIVGSVDWKSSTALSGTQATRANAVGYLSIPAAGSRCTAWLRGQFWYVCGLAAVDRGVRPNVSCACTSALCSRGN